MSLTRIVVYAVVCVAGFCVFCLLITWATPYLVTTPVTEARRDFEYTRAYDAETHRLQDSVAAAGRSR